MIQKLILVAILSVSFAVCGSAQNLPGPGAERDMEKIRDMQRGSVLRKDSVMIIDRISVVDPETGAEKTQVIINAYSVYDYCRLLLGINDPDQLLNGQPMTITDPANYQEMTVRWNASESKIDTIK